MYYLDTSVLVALYIPESKSNEIQVFVSSSGQTALSSLNEVEFYSALSRRVRMKEISHNDGQRIISQFQLHRKSQIYRTYLIMQKEYDLARNWIGNFETPLRTLDGLHLAVAFSNNLEIVTADTALTKSAKKLRIKAILF